jgi:hypothetical protein
MATNQLSEIYKDYLAAKEDKSIRMVEVANKHGMSLRSLQYLIKDLRNGNMNKVNACMHESRINCLWEFKYRPRASVIPNDRNAATIKELRSLIHEMSKDKIPPYRIGKFLGKNHATIIHHLSGK